MLKRGTGFLNLSALPMSTNPNQSKISVTQIADDSTLNINTAEITAIAEIIFCHGTIRDWKSFLVTAGKIGVKISDEIAPADSANESAVDSNALRLAIRKELNNWDFSSEISDAISNHDFSCEISDAVRDCDFSDEIQSAVRHHDFSDEINDAISDKDFSDEISEAISNHDFSDAISSAVDEHDFSDVLQSSDARETILEIVKDWFKNLMG